MGGTAILALSKVTELNTVILDRQIHLCDVCLLVVSQDQGDKTPGSHCGWLVVGYSP